MGEHRIQIRTDAVESWECTCGQWAYVSDVILDQRGLQDLRRLHEHHSHGEISAGAAK